MEVAELRSLSYDRRTTSAKRRAANNERRKLSRRNGKTAEASAVNRRKRGQQEISYQVTFYNNEYLFRV